MLSILEPIELHVTKRGPQWKVRLYFVVKKTPDSLPNVEKKKTRAISATLLRSRVKMCKMRPVFPFTVTLKPSYEYCLTKQTAENGGITQFL